MKETVSARNCMRSLQILFFLRFYLFLHERHKEGESEAETQAEGEAGSMQGAGLGTRAQVSTILG